MKNLKFFATLVLILSLSIFIFSGELEKKLFQAVKDGNLEVVRSVVNEGVDINIKNEYGLMPIHVAAEYNRPEVLKFLVSKGADVNAATNADLKKIVEGLDQGKVILKFVLQMEGFSLKDGLFLGLNHLTPIHFAALNGNLELVKYLVGQGADVNARGIDGMTVLLYASKSGNLELVKYLVDDLGMNIKEKDKLGFTPLHYSLISGNVDVIKYLVENGADVNAKLIKSDGYRLCLYFSDIRKSGFDVLKGESFVFSRGDTPLLIAVSRSSEVDVVKYLIRSGANVNVRSDSGLNLLHVAAKVGNLEVLKYLVEEVGMDPDERSCPKLSTFQGFPSDNLGFIETMERFSSDFIKVNCSAPIHFAASKGYLDVVKYLAKCGADIKSKGRDGRTVFHYACYGGNLELVKYLLENFNFDVNEADKCGCTPLIYAIRGKSENKIELLKYLLGKGANPDSSVKMGEVERIYFLSQNADFLKYLGKDKSVMKMKQKISKLQKLFIGVSWYRGAKPIHFAVESKDLKIVELLVSSGVDINSLDDYGNTPLYYALKGKASGEIVRYFLDQGANLNLKNMDKETPLFYAVGSGNLDIVKEFVSRGADLNVINSDGENLLFLATSDKNLDVVSYLIDNGVGVNCINKRGETPLLNAAEYSNLNIVKYLIERGARIDVKDKEGNGVLHYAVNGGNWDIIKYFVEEMGVGVNEKNKEKVTPLHLACENPNYKIIEYLVEKGADVNAKDKKGNTPLHYLVGREFCDLKIVKFLIKSGAKVNAKNKEGDTPLHLAVVNCKPDVVKYLISSGADVNAKNEDGEIPLCEAVGSGIEMVKLLVSNGAKVNIKMKGVGLGPLHMAVFTEDFEVVKYLVEHGADVDSGGHWWKLEKTTPLLLAAEKGNLKIVKYLIEHGAKVDGKYRSKWYNEVEYGYTPILIAAKHGNSDVVKYLAEKGAKLYVRSNLDATVLHYSALNCDVDLLEYLINEKDMDPDVGEIDSSFVGKLFNNLNDKAGVFTGLTPLFWAIKSGDFNKVKCLVLNGASVNSENKDEEIPINWFSHDDDLTILTFLIENGSTASLYNLNLALYPAITNNYIHVVNSLLRMGADLNMKYCGEFPLHLAARMGHLKIVKELIKAGAILRSGIGDLQIAAMMGDLEKLRNTENGGLTVKDEFGNTLLHYAAANGQIEVVKFLVENGLDVNVKNKYGLTPLHMASECGFVDVAKYLVSKGADVNSKGLQIDVLPFLDGCEKYCSVLPYLARSYNFDVHNLIKELKYITPVGMAVKYGKLDVVKFLIESGAKPWYGIKDIHIAAMNGDVEKLKESLSKGEKINERDFFGHTPLHYAVINNQIEMVKFLISNGAKVDVYDYYLVIPHYESDIEYVDFFRNLTYISRNKNLTPLHYAILNGNLEMVKLLVENGAKLYRKTSFLYNRGRAIHLAVMSNNLEIVKFMVENAGVKLDKKNGIGWTPVLVATATGNLEMIKYLLSRGAKIRKVKDYFDNNAIHLAIGTGNVDVIKYLISNKVKVNAKNYFDFTPIFLASRFGYLDVVKLLISNGAKYKKSISYIGFPITQAVKNGHLNIVKYFIEDLGFNVGKKDSDGYTLLHRAAYYGDLEMVKYLIDRGASWNTCIKYYGYPVFKAAEGGHLNVVKYFVEELGFDVNKRDKDSWTVLHWAAMGDKGEDNVKVVQYLLSKGLDIDVSTKKGLTPLYVASGMGCVEVVKYLISKGAEWKRFKKKYGYPITYAVMKGNLEVVKYFIEDLNYDFNKRDQRKRILLDWAAKNCQVDVVKYLVKMGADVGKINKNIRFWVSYNCPSVDAYLNGL